jgi:hypothetical protein
MYGRLARAPFVLLAAGIAVAAFSLTFTHFAGSFGGSGFEDGSGNVARFNGDAGIAVDTAGNVYVADTSNHTIRKISPSGTVTTLAGLAETPQSGDGRGAHALFNSPKGIAVDSAGTVYVADTGNHTIRKITSAGVASTFVGYPGISGFVNSTGGAPRFNSPRGVTVDGSGNVYVADTGNHSIRKVTPGGVVTTLAGTGSAGNVNNTGTAASFNTPIGIVYDAVSAALFVADSANHVIRRITLPSAVVTTFAGTMGTSGHGDGVPGFLYTPSGICADASGMLYVTDTTDHTIRSVTSGGSLASVAGLPFYPGPANGTGSGARFTSPAGIAVTGATIYVADTGNHTVRKIESGNVVTTFAGTANASGFVNDTGSAARFDGPSGVAYYPGPSGFAAYVADTNNNAIRRVTTAGVVTTLAGGTYGYLNGSGTSAQFRNPKGLGLNLNVFSVFVADTGNHVIRLVDSSGNVSLFAGQPLSSGSSNGDRLTTASFKSPQAVTFSVTTSAVYVADTGNFLVRRIDANGTVTTLAGSGSFGSTNANGTSASFGVLTGIMVDESENVYVAESQTYTIRKITPAGDVTTLAGACCNGPVDGTGTAARFGYPGPTSISGDYSSGNAFIADPNANLIRTITLGGGVVGTAGGRANVKGTSDGTGAFARFSGASTISAFGTSMVIAEGNTLRFGGPEIADRATIDSASGLIGNLRQLDASPHTATTWSWSIIRRPSGSTATLSSSTVRNPTFTPDVPDLFVFRCVATSGSGSSISTVSLQGNGATTSFSVGYPGPQVAGIVYPMQVTARDADSNVGDGYTGTVHFTSSDGTATLPANYTFVSADHGARYLNFTFRHSGFQSITTTDTVTGSITGTSFVFISPAAAVSLSLSMPSPVGSGNPVDITVTARDTYGNTATSYNGTVHFTSSDGTATLPSNYTFVPGTAQGSHVFPLGVTLRAGGTRTVTATDTITGSITGFVSVIVGPPIPTSFTANGTASQVFLAWNPSSGADHYEIWRASAATGTYAFLTSTTSTFYSDNGVSTGAVYVYKVRAVDAATNTSPFSAPDPATTIVFTDDPVVAQTTLIKAVHMNEARQAVNGIRACAGSGALTVTDPTLTGGIFVKAIHIQELRTALNAARATLGLPAIVFTNPTLTVNTSLIRTFHVAEIRDSVK